MCLFVDLGILQKQGCSLTHEWYTFGRHYYLGKESWPPHPSTYTWELHKSSWDVKLKDHFILAQKIFWNPYVVFFFPQHLFPWKIWRALKSMDSICHSKINLSFSSIFHKLFEGPFYLFVSSANHNILSSGFPLWVPHHWFLCMLWTELCSYYSVKYFVTSVHLKQEQRFRTHSFVWIDLKASRDLHCSLPGYSINWALAQTMREKGREREMDGCKGNQNQI